MATTTDNYGLIKPGIDDFYDIGVQNDNWDAVDTALEEHAQQLSPSGEKESPADSDSLILTDSTANGIKKRLSWTGVKTALGKVFAGLQHTHSMEEVDALGAALANKVDADWVKELTQQPLAQGVTILDRIRELEKNGIYRGTFQAIASADTPEDSTGWGFNISFFHGEKTVVFAVKSYFPLYWFRQIDSNGWIGDWIPIATATKPAVYDLPLAAGWAVENPTGRPAYFKDQFGKVTVNIKVKSTQTINTSMLGGLPEGYRPIPGCGLSIPCNFTLEDYSRGTGHLDFTAGGNIDFYPDDTLDKPIRTLFCPTATFVAA